MTNLHQHLDLLEVELEAQRHIQLTLEDRQLCLVDRQNVTILEQKATKETKISITNTNGSHAKPKCPRRMSHRPASSKAAIFMRQSIKSFSHREADEKSRLDEAIRRGMGERGRADGDLLGRSDRSISLGPRK